VGIYPSILPAVAHALFGSSRQLIVNPDAAAQFSRGTTALLGMRNRVLAIMIGEKGSTRRVASCRLCAHGST
jgi:hypothetical protein